MAKHVGDTTGVVIAPSDVACSTPRVSVLRFVCVCGSQTQLAYSRDGLTMACYARVLTNSEEWWILRLTKPSALFALEVTVAMCLFQLRSDVIVIPRYLADLTFSRALLWSLYGHLIGHFFAINREDLAFARVEFHKPFCFPVCKSIYTFL